MIPLFDDPSLSQTEQKLLVDRFLDDIINRRAMVVENDEIRALLFKPTYSAIESKRVYSLAYYLFTECVVRRIPVVWDATNMSLVGYWIEHATIIVLKVTPDEVQQRLETGGDRSYSEADYDIYLRIAKYQPSLEKIADKLGPKVIVRKSSPYLSSYLNVVPLFETKKDYPYFILAGPPFSGKSRFSRFFYQYFQRRTDDDN